MMKKSKMQHNMRQWRKLEREVKLSLVLPHDLLQFFYTTTSGSFYMTMFDRTWSL